MDAVKMGHIIAWLGTVTNRGLSPQQLKPFLQSYEQSGHLTSTMAQLTYKSLEDLDGAQGGNPNQTFSASEYAECLLELHEIICNPGSETRISPSIVAPQIGNSVPDKSPSRAYSRSITPLTPITTALKTNAMRITSRVREMRLRY